MQICSETSNKIVVYSIYDVYPMDDPNAQTSTDPSERRPITLASLSLGATLGVVGALFGVLATEAGLSTAQACAMSLLVFTGATQFTVVAILNSGGSIVAALLSGTVLAARNLAYGPIVAPWFRSSSRAERLLIAQLVIDESTAVGAAQRTDPLRKYGFLAGGLSVYFFWNLGTLLGALMGNLVQSPEAFGLDAAFPAAFIALLLPHLRTSEGRRAAGIAAVLVGAALTVLPGSAAILAAVLGAVIIGWNSKALPSEFEAEPA